MRTADLFRIALTLMPAMPANLGAQSQNALDFDGFNDWVEINSISGEMANQNSFTIEFWARVDSIYQTAQGALIGNHTSSGGNNFIIFAGGGGSNNGLTVYDAVGTAAYEIQGGKVADNSWHHVAYVRSGNQGEAFLDGVSQGTHTPNYSFASNNVWSIGQEWDGASTSDHINGRIDDLRFWKVARTKTQIQNDMNRELCTQSSSLVAYYKFNQGIPSATNTGLTTLLDYSGYDNKGNLKNFGLAANVSNWTAGKSLSLDTSSTFMSDTGCISYSSPSGKYLWTQSGIYKDTIKNGANCDNVVTVDLTIIPLDTTVTNSSAFLTANQTGATYHWLDCDNNFIPVSNGSNQVYKPKQNGNFAVILIKDGCVDTTMCYNVTSVGIGDNVSIDFDISPNPVQHSVLIRGMNHYLPYDFSVTDMQGKLLLSHRVTEEYDNEIDLSGLPQGLYIGIVNKNGRSSYRKFLKE